MPPGRQTALAALFLLISIYYTVAAPAHCRACKKNCPGSVPFNTTNASNDTDLIEDIVVNRTKRSSAVEVAPCQAFPIEVILIPLAISIIPLALCALLFCTCCCGPEESRAKKPENMMEAVRKYSVNASRKKSTLPSEEMELEYKDGYVQRKDSKMTKFSTTVAYIEAPRRQSIWSVGTNSQPPSVPTSPIKKTPSTDSLKRFRFSDTVTVCEEHPNE